MSMLTAVAIIGVMMTAVGYATMILSDEIGRATGAFVTCLGLLGLSTSVSMWNSKDVATDYNGTVEDRKSSDWRTWHDRTKSEDLKVAEMTDASGGRDYAGAVDVIRHSKRPEDVRSFQMGMLVIEGLEQDDASRPPESLEQGLRMAEDATTMGGEMRRNGPQQLRLLFERGAGRLGDVVSVDMTVADCWRRLEHGGKGDPAVCIALRRKGSKTGG